MQTFKRLMAVVIVVGAVVFGVGLYLDWFHFSTSRDEENHRYMVSLAVNRGKIIGDTEAVKEKAKEIGQPLDGTKTVKGTLSKVDEADRRLILTTTDNKEMVFQIPTSLKARLSDLRPSDEVTVAYKVENDKNVAQSVSIAWGV